MTGELRLLREDQLAPTFKKAMRRAGASVIAVPFWGKGAIATLGLVKGAELKVICNLDHPGCNPDVIAGLKKLRIRVKTHPRLHAKIYATQHLAIVGSSNVSTNGLTVEGSAAKGWIEANVASDESAFVEGVLKLFDQIWTDDSARNVTASDIKAAREARESLPPMLFDLPRGMSLFEAARKKPAAFFDVYVAAYSVGLGEGGKRLLKAVKSSAAPPRDGLSASDFRRAWGYQFEDIPEGAWLIDLSCKRAGHPKVHGCALATGVRLPVRNQEDEEYDLTIALRQVISVGGRKFRLLEREKESLRIGANRICKATGGGLLPLRDAISIMDSHR